jgi:hypothetical protein
MRRSTGTDTETLARNVHWNRFRRDRIDLASEREGSETAVDVTTITWAERERRVAEAIHSGEMEGLDVTPAGRDDAQEYVAGRIDLTSWRSCPSALWPG